jgi:hypothetical protein
MATRMVYGKSSHGSNRKQKKERNICLIILNAGLIFQSLCGTIYHLSYSEFCRPYSPPKAHQNLIISRSKNQKKHLRDTRASGFIRACRQLPATLRASA